MRNSFEPAAAALLVTDSDKVDCRHSNVSSRAEIMHFGHPGRARCFISRNKLEFLLDMKFASGEIASMLYVSKSIVKRRICEYETFVQDKGIQTSLSMSWMRLLKG